MTTDQQKRAGRTDFWIAAAIIASGLAVSGFSLMKLSANDQANSATSSQYAQSQTAPADTTKRDAPAEAKRGGARPTTPAPEPARPDAKARESGAESALPPAPAEKAAPPIKEK